MSRARRASPGHADRPYRLIVTDNPDQMLGKGQMTHFATCLEACNAFVKHPAQYKTIVYDNGHEARELDQREERMLAAVCEKLGLEIEDVNG